MRQTGFTLVEMTVVLLLITLMASVAVRETAELGFQTRYEQTKERLDIIRQAILGNPKQIINSQQAVSGFVADMGRLPGSVRDLLQPSACVTVTNVLPDSPLQCVDAGETWTWFNSLCTDGVSLTKADCSSAGGVWLGWQLDSASGLGFGWRGPYLNVSGNPNSTDTLTDGWGRTGVDNTATPSIDEAISNYGWELSNTPSNNDLKILSYGKDQLPGGNCSGSDFNDDCFSQILAMDYQTDIFPGITVQLKGRAFSMDSHCSNASFTIRTDCESDGGIWYGGCSEGIAGSPSYANKTTCEAAGKTWKSCSLTSHTTQTDCETNQGIWYGEGFGCTNDASKLDETSCGSSNWNSCSDKTKTTRTTCEATSPSSNWFGNGTTSESRLLCLRLYHHLNGSVAILSPVSSPAILEDGTIQNVVFDFPANSLISAGEARIAIYYQRGTDGCKTTIPYPLVSKPLPITVYPRTPLPVINW